MANAKPKIDAVAVREAESAVRDLKNWIAVFAEEYELPDEAIEKLNSKAEELVEKISNISCR